MDDLNDKPEKPVKNPFALLAEGYRQRQTDMEAKAALAFAVAHKKMSGLCRDPEMRDVLNGQLQILVGEQNDALEHRTKFKTPLDHFKFDDRTVADLETIPFKTTVTDAHPYCTILLEAEPVTLKYDDENRIDYLRYIYDDVHSPVREATVNYHPDMVSRLTHDELVKAGLHEIVHALHKQQIMGLEAKAQMLCDDEALELCKQSAELICDAGSDAAMPFPAMAELRARLTTVHDISPASLSQAEAQKLLFSQKAEDGYPSGQKFHASSQRVSSALSDVRATRYLEDIYDGYVPGYLDKPKITGQTTQQLLQQAAESADDALARPGQELTPNVQPSFCRGR